MNIVLYEDWGWQRFLPLVYTRSLFELFCGMDDLLAKVRRLHPDPALWCRPGLASLTTEQTRSPTNTVLSEPTLLLNGRGLWSQLPTIDAGDSSWIGTIGEAIACIWADTSLAATLTPELLLDEARTRAALAGLPRRNLDGNTHLIDWPWDLVHANRKALISDWDHIAHHRSHSGRIDTGSVLLNPDAIHIGSETRIKPCSVIDAENGPVWIGNRVTIMPHVYIQGPAYIGNASLLQPGATIREGTSIGPVCKVGGEIEASVIQGYSNKQHDGFLGHSYIGSWVNIAADCINSDLKNTYGTVRVPINGYEVDSGETFVGMMMGDHSKAGINVSFPTGSVIGFCSSIFAPRSPKFVPSFAWIDGNQVDRYDEARGLEIARKVMARRDKIMSPTEERAFLTVARLAFGIERQDLGSFAPEQ